MLMEDEDSPPNPLKGLRCIPKGPPILHPLPLLKRRHRLHRNVRNCHNPILDRSLDLVERHRSHESFRGKGRGSWNATQH